MVEERTDGGQTSEDVLLLARLVSLTTQAEPSDSSKLKWMVCTNFGHKQHLQQLIYPYGG